MEHSGATSSGPILRIRVESVVVALGAVVFVVLLFVGAGPPKRPQAPVQRPQPTATSPDRLRALSASLAHPVYWLGERPGTKLELTVTRTDRIFLRYLPKNGLIGNQSLAYPFVVTFGYPKAFDAVRRASRKKGAVVRRLPGGGLAIQDKRAELVKVVAGGLPSAPVFLAYPGSDRLVEVYDRSPERALSLVASGRVRPVR